MMRRCFGLGLGLLLAPSVVPAGRLASQGITFEQVVLTLVTGIGRHDFKVDVADNQSNVELGLRYPRSASEAES